MRSNEYCDGMHHHANCKHDIGIHEPEMDDEYPITEELKNAFPHLYGREKHVASEAKPALTPGEMRVKRMTGLTDPEKIKKLAKALEGKL